MWLDWVHLIRVQAKWVIIKMSASKYNERLKKTVLHSRNPEWVKARFAHLNPIHFQFMTLLCNFRCFFICPKYFFSYHLLSFYGQVPGRWWCSCSVPPLAKFLHVLCTRTTSRAKLTGKKQAKHILLSSFRTNYCPRQFYPAKVINFCFVENLEGRQEKRHVFTLFIFFCPFSTGFVTKPRNRF